MGEDTEQEQQIKNRLAELPEEVRDAVLSAELGMHVQEIGQHHGLHVDQIGKLQDETMLVMLGFFDLDQFDTQLQEQLQVPATDAAAIAQDVNTAVFLPIRESLKQFAAEKRAPTPVAIRIAPVSTPAVIPPNPLPAVVTPPASPAVTPAPTMPAAEQMLTEKTVVRPVYKADPYREPLE